MLSVQQKATILKKAGQAVPTLPADSDSAAHNEWARTVENLYVAYVAARAAKSLRDSEEARQLERLRHLASTVYA
ncbi:MAG TPA: hypothetical protein VLJ19_10220 [Variovorax sp.]|nr:hypothetical protein [Variovorax sp.]